MTNLRYVPDYRVTINDEPIPSALRASISSVSYETGLEGADRVELTLVNDNLRWLDHPLLALDNKLTLSIGYASDPLEQVFVGEITGQTATFPNEGGPTVTVIAQDLLHRLQQGTKTRWFAVPIERFANFSLPDQIVAGLISAENRLIPIGLDPLTGFIGSALAVLIAGINILLTVVDSENGQKLIRKQLGESDFKFLSRIARENGMEVLIDHTGPHGGHKLRFLSPLAEREPAVILKYGRSLIDFSPAITNVGQIIGVSLRVWWAQIKTEFTVTLSADWDRSTLDLDISPGLGLPGGVSGTRDALNAAREKATSDEARKGIDKELGKLDESSTNFGLEHYEEVQEPVSLATAPRVLVGKLLPRLNKRLTGSGSTVGDPTIKAGSVVQLEGIGEQLGGRYRVTSATHTLGRGGYRTSFEVRKEIWFGSIPLIEQGAVKLGFQGQPFQEIGV